MLDFKDNIKNFDKKNLKLPNKSFYEKISEYFHEFCNKTTFHGLKFVGDSNISWFERFFFAAAFTLVSFGAGYFIWHAYSKWCLSPIFIGFSATPFYINKIPFPTVTICNMNQALLSKVKNINEDSSDIFLQTICEKNDHKHDKYVNDSEHKWEHFESFIEKVAQPCDRMILECKFSKNPKILCNEVFFPVITDEGLCCTFNALSVEFLYNYRTITDDDTPKTSTKTLNRNLKNGLKRFLTLGERSKWLTTESFVSKNLYYIFNNISSKTVQGRNVAVNWNPESGYPNGNTKHVYPRPGIGTGVSMGLHLILDAEVDEYYCSSTNSAGFKVLIHSPVEVPHIKETGISIDVGTENRIRITPEFELASDSVKNNIKIKDRKCYFKNEKKLKYFRTYTRRNCEMECEAELLALKCNCIRYYMPIVRSNISICGLREQDCADKYTFKSRLMDSNVDGNCDEECFPSCYDLSFLQDVFTTRISAKNFTKKDSKILEKITSKHISQSISILNFYYKDNAFYGQKKEEFTGMTEFLSNTGGLMGLFLGFSCISIVEIFYYLTIRPICAEIRKRKQRN